MNANISVLVICVEATRYLLYNLDECTFNFVLVSLTGSHFSILTKKGQYDTAKLEILINTTKTTNIFMFYIKCYKNGCLSLIRGIFKVLYRK